jgi:hypothetical protein
MPRMDTHNTASFSIIDHRPLSQALKPGELGGWVKKNSPPSRVHLQFFRSIRCMATCPVLLKSPPTTPHQGTLGTYVGCDVKRP